MAACRNIRSIGSTTTGRFFCALVTFLFLSISFPLESASSSDSEENYIFGVLSVTMNDVETGIFYFSRAKIDGKIHPFAEASISSLEYFLSGSVTEKSATLTVRNLYLARARHCIPHEEKKPGRPDEVRLSLWEMKRCIGLSYYLREIYQQAESELTEVLIAKPDDTASLIIRGLTRIKRKKIPEAIIDFERAKNTGKALILTYRGIGMSWFKLGNYENSEKSFSRCLSLGDNTSNTFLLRGLSRLYQGKHISAIADFEEASRISPKRPEPMVNIGFSHYLMKNYDEAIRYFNIAIALDPNCARAYFQRALCYYNRGDHERFTADIRKALQLNPEIYYEDDDYLY